MENKKVYQEKMEAQLREWESKYKALQAQAYKMKADAKIEYNKQLVALNSKKELVQNKLEELKEAGSETWSSMKERVDSTWNILKNATEAAASEFRKGTK